MSLVELVRVAGINKDESAALTDLQKAANVMNFPVGDDSGISANGIKVVHVHGPEPFGLLWE